MGITLNVDANLTLKASNNPSHLLYIVGMLKNTTTYSVVYQTKILQPKIDFRNLPNANYSM